MEKGKIEDFQGKKKTIDESTEAATSEVLKEVKKEEPIAKKEPPQKKDTSCKNCQKKKIDSYINLGLKGAGFVVLLGLAFRLVKGVK